MLLPSNRGLDHLTSWELSGPWHPNSIPLKCPKSNLWRNSFPPHLCIGVCVYLIISLVGWPSLKGAPCHLPWKCSKPSLYKKPGGLKTQISRELNCIQIRLRLFDSQKQGQSEANWAKAIVQQTNPDLLFTKGLSQLVSKGKKYPERNAELDWVRGESLKPCPSPPRYWMGPSSVLLTLLQHLSMTSVRIFDGDGGGSSSADTLDKCREPRCNTMSLGIKGWMRVTPWFEGRYFDLLQDIDSFFKNSILV